MNKNVILLASAGLMLVASQAPAAAPTGEAAKAALAQMEPDVRANTIKFEESLHPQSGNIQIPGGHSTLQLGDGYYFYPAEDAKRLLVDAWGNPPDSVSNVLGMVFPKGRHFYDGSWGAVLSYEDTGHIDDKDAASEDYDKVLADMRSGEEEENQARKDAGYGAVHLVGWAQAPTYDPAGKTLIWARNIRFDGEQGNTLNYDVRKLGRTGVLSMNMVDSMDHLGTVRQAALDLGTVVKFNGGSQYADFDSATDKTADYGLAGLVAAGAGVAVAKKAGILGIILLFLKKGFVLLLAAAAGGWAWFKRKMGIGGSVDESDEGHELPESDRPEDTGTSA